MINNLKSYSSKLQNVMVKIKPFEESFDFLMQKFKKNEN